MRYYYDALLRSLANDYDYVVPSVFSDGQDIFAVNIPRVDTTEWTESPFATTGKAGRFIQLVESESESESDGTAFDVGFACEIAAHALDEKTLAFVQDGVGRHAETSKNEFDDWLEGFSTTQ